MLRMIADYDLCSSPQHLEFSEIPRCPMITHTSDSHQIPTQNKTKSNIQILKIAKNSNFIILQETLHVTHLLKLLDKMYKYKMDPIRTVGTAERTRDAGGLDRQMDGRTDGVKPIYPPTTSLREGYNYLCSPKTIQYMRGQYWKQLQLGPMNPLLCMWTWG